MPTLNTQKLPTESMPDAVQTATLETMLTGNMPTAILLPCECGHRHRDLNLVYAHAAVNRMQHKQTCHQEAYACLDGIRHNGKYSPEIQATDAKLPDTPKIDPTWPTIVQDECLQHWRMEVVAEWAQAWMPGMAIVVSRTSRTLLASQQGHDKQVFIVAETGKAGYRHRSVLITVNSGVDARFFLQHPKQREYEGEMFALSYDPPASTEPLTGFSTPGPLWMLRWNPRTSILAALHHPAYNAGLGTGPWQMFDTENRADAPLELWRKLLSEGAKKFDVPVFPNKEE